MNSKNTAYWICQIVGWVFYGLTMVFFSFVFGQSLAPYQYLRLILSLIMGIVFTHILRYLICAFELKPPIKKNLWLILPLIVIFISVSYSLVNSAIVEWVELYNPKIKFTFFRRFLYNILNDGPIILIWIAIYYVWHYIEASRKAEINRISLEGSVKELELKTIKSHINPHFIFNALNSIRALVDENPKRARTAITQLSNILRSSLQAEKTETSSLERELNIVKDYLALEFIRFEDRLKVEYWIEEETLIQQVPPMMLQTLVENGIKHGISKQVNGGVIRIISRINDNFLELIVQNTGKLNLLDNTDGFGIAGTKNRLWLMYGEKAFFQLKDLDIELVEAKVLIPK